MLTTVPFDTAVLAIEDAAMTVYVGGPGGAGRVQVRDGSDIVIADFFAIDPNFRAAPGHNSVNVAYDEANNDLYTSPELWGGQFTCWDDLDVIADGIPKRLGIELHGMMMTGWDAVVPPHPRDAGVIPLEQHPIFAVRNREHVAAMERALTYVPRAVQERLLQAGVRLVIHDGDMADLLGLDPDALAPDGLRTLRTIRSFYVNGVAYCHHADGAIAHELGHALWDRVLTQEQRDATGTDSEAFAVAFDEWCYSGSDPTGFFADVFEEVFV